MRKLLFLLIPLCLQKALHAQHPYIYTIKADSVKITNSCDTAELIIENHTQTVPGFLFNKGRGRTEFRRPVLKISDSIYLIGLDTLRLSGAWLQGGNTFGTTGFFGTRDNNHIDFYTNNTARMRLSTAGNLLLNTNTDDGYKLQVNGSVSLTNSDTYIKSPRFPVLIGDDGGGGGAGFLFNRDATARPIKIGTEHSNNFHKFYFQTAGQPYDTIANYNFTYNGLIAPALNIYSFYEGRTKLLLTAPGNLLLGSTDDNGAKLQVIGNVFANGNQHKLGNLAIVSGAVVGTSGFATGIQIDDSSYGSFIFQGTNQGVANDMFIFTDAYGGLGQDIINKDQSIIRISSGVKSNNIAGNSANMLNIQPEYNLDPSVSNPLTIRGIYYKPKLTSLIGSKHIAIETVNGDVRLHTTNGRTGIGLDGSSAITSRLDVSGEEGYNQLRLRKKFTPTSSSDANGAEGDVSWDDNYIYIKTSSGWKRTALGTF